MSATADPLSLWNDTATRRAIVEFVEAIAGADGQGFVPPDERVAVFDNDGTLWCEKPMPIELAEARPSAPAGRIAVPRG